MLLKRFIKNAQVKTLMFVQLDHAHTLLVSAWADFPLSHVKVTHMPPTLHAHLLQAADDPSTFLWSLPFLSNWSKNVVNVTPSHVKRKWKWKTSFRKGKMNKKRSDDCPSVTWQTQNCESHYYVAKNSASSLSDLPPSGPNCCTKLSSLQADLSCRQPCRIMWWPHHDLHTNPWKTLIPLWIQVLRDVKHLFITKSHVYNCYCNRIQVLCDCTSKWFLLT